MRVFDYSIYIFFPFALFLSLRNYLSFEFRFALYCIRIRCLRIRYDCENITDNRGGLVLFPTSKKFSLRNICLFIKPNATSRAGARQSVPSSHEYCTGLRFRISYVPALVWILNSTVRYSIEAKIITFRYLIFLLSELSVRYVGIEAF